MRRFVDLHIHSTASDGSSEPAALVGLADAAGLAAMALTDHDTLAGLAEARKAAREYPDLAFINGIELSARPICGALHIVGLGIDENSPALRRVAEFLRDARRRRNPKIVARLQHLGLDIEMDDVHAAVPQRAAGRGDDVIGRPHIAKALVRKGLARNETEVFEQYLARGRPGYVERERPKAREIIRAIRDAGGLAVAAHLAQWNCSNNAQVERILRELVGYGLNGIETYHPDHSDDQKRFSLELARRLDLRVTGGSDFHGAVKPQVRLGWPRVPISALSAELLTRLAADS